MRKERISLGSSTEREDLARQLVRAHERPVAWCVVDWASEATAALTDLLVADWGPGLCYQPGAPWADPTRPAVLPKDPGTDYPAATENEAVALPFSPVEQDGLPAVTLGIPSGGQLDGADAVPTAVP